MSIRRVFGEIARELLTFSEFMVAEVTMSLRSRRRVRTEETEGSETASVSFDSLPEKEEKDALFLSRPIKTSVLNDLS